MPTLLHSARTCWQGAVPYICTCAQLHIRASFAKIRETSVKIILLNADVGMYIPCEKQWEQGVFLAILSRILAQSCVTPPYICIVLVSLIVLLLLRRLLVPTVFRTVHPYISGRMIFTLVHNNSMYMDIHVYYMYMHVYKITLHAEYTAFKWWDHVCTCTYVYMYIYTMYI